MAVAQLDHQTLKHIVSEGIPGTSMPAWEDVLSDVQLDEVVTYVLGTLSRGSNGAQSNKPSGDAQTLPTWGRARLDAAPL